jgi:hypothetical protein
LEVPGAMDVTVTEDTLTVEISDGLGQIGMDYAPHVT